MNYARIYVSKIISTNYEWMKKIQRLKIQNNSNEIYSVENFNFSPVVSL